MKEDVKSSGPLGGEGKTVEADETYFGKKASQLTLGEIALLATVILHALNGIRLTMVDMGVGLTRQRQVFWYFAIGVGAVLFLAGAIPMFIYGILRHS